MLLSGKHIIVITIFYLYCVYRPINNFKLVEILYDDFFLYLNDNENKLKSTIRHVRPH